LTIRLKLIIAIVIGLSIGIPVEQPLANFDKEQRVILTFKHEVDEKLIENANGEMNLELDHAPIAAVTISSSDLEDLKNNSEILKEEPDIMVKTSNQVLDWGIPAMNIPLSWNSGYSGKGVKVAIIDTGISPHEDLKITGGESFVDYTDSFYDDNGHGTHVAGIIGGRDNGFGIKGVASDAEIYAVKSFSGDGKAYLSDIFAGIDWSISNDMDIINMSLGTQVGSPAFRTILDRAYEKGVLFVAAAGNDGTGSGDTIDFPARYDSVIGVGAIDQQNILASFSSTGPSLEVVAPGVDILSTFLDGSYARLSGTSMAAPFVTGYLALLKQAYPSLTNIELREVLNENTLDLGEAGRDPLYGNGLIQGSAMLPAVGLMDFKDVGPTYWAYKEISDLRNKEIISGYSDNTFQPLATVRRDHVAVLFSRSIPLDPKVDVADDFLDVPKSYLFYNEIKRTQLAGIFSGTSGKFGPKDQLTRAQMAKILVLALNLSGNQQHPFTDISSKHWANDYISILYANGITLGTNGKYLPDQPVTRAQYAVFLHRAFEATE
jgi:hypothetical protein